MPLIAIKQHSVLPGFRLSLGFTLFYLSLVVLLPFTALIVKTMELSGPEFWAIITEPRVMATYRLTISSAFLAAVVNLVFGSLVAWVLVRYQFRGRRVIDALIDLPFALPTAVTGIALVAIYRPTGPLGSLLLNWGLKVAYTPIGITLALIFIGFPFVVRTVQPILEDFEQELEEAAAALGASRWYTIRRVIIPPLLPAMLTGFSLAFARGLGEYGSVIFIAGNIPMVSEVTPLIIITKLEQYDYQGATAIACAMLCFSLLMLLSTNYLQTWMMKYQRQHQGVLD